MLVSLVSPADVPFLVTYIGYEKLIAAGIFELETPEPSDPPQTELVINPLQKPGIANDSAQDGEDMLGFENDIRAFALLIALKELKPPLAIALFGAWGSGKSFFMHQLQKKVAFLSKQQGFEEMVEKEEGEEAGSDEPFCKGVVQISFNAWSYMDANLWASLVSNIFDKLDEYITEQSEAKGKIEQAKKILNEQLTVVSDEKNKILGEKNQLKTELNGLQNKIVELEKEKDEKLKELAGKTTRELYQPILDKLSVDQTLQEQLKKYGLDEEEIKNLAPDQLFDEARSWLGFVRNLLRFDGATVFLLLLAAGAFCLALFNPGDWLGKAGDFLGKSVLYYSSVLLPVLARILVSYRRFMKFYQPLKNRRDEFNRQVKELIENNEKEIRQKQLEIETKNRELSDCETRLSQVEEKIGRIDEELKNSVIRKAFFDFIREKSVDEKYEQSLSIISTIRRDFETLSDLFREYNIAHRPSDPDERKEFDKKKELADQMRDTMEKPLDRIVLYIDDLDRCSEDRVIEVLEAVNLLMAFPLFVVVVGVDPRWVRNALIKKYTLQFTGLLNQVDLKEKLDIQPIRVSDYLEKIFQVPFHLREAAKDGVDKLIDAQLDGQVKEDGADTLSLLPEQKNPLQELERKGFVPDLIRQEKSGETSFISMETGAIGANSSVGPGAQNRVIQPGEDKRSLVHFQPQGLNISPEESAYLKQLAWLVGPNPRALKRYVNIYRIIRAHENLSYRQQNAQACFAAVAFLAALGTGAYREKAAGFYATCRDKGEAGFKELLEGSGLRELIAEKEKSGADAAALLVRFPAPLHALAGSSFVPYTGFVKRFSFDQAD